MSFHTHAPGKLVEKGDRDPASEVTWPSNASSATPDSKTPDIGFLGKEEGGNSTGHKLLWMLDPSTTP
jgi:hypothetical protein